MKKGLESKLLAFGVSVIRQLLFCGNLLLLVLLGVKTGKAWISEPFDFSDMLKDFPNEPEFLNQAVARKQFWFALGFETVIFLIGGFLCYEMFIKRKTFRRLLLAPLIIAFIFATGAAAKLFLPATDKAATIETCKKNNISWNVKTHRCNLMDLEFRRFEKMMADKKKRKAAPVLIQKPKTEIKPSPAVPAPIVKKPTHTPAVVKKGTKQTSLSKKGKTAGKS